MRSFTLALALLGGAISAPCRGARTDPIGPDDASIAQTPGDAAPPTQDALADAAPPYPDAAPLYRDAAPHPDGSAEYPTPLVREEQEVVIDGTTETWRLKWAAPPKPYCGLNDDWESCPCWPFAYGEIGDLFLSRLRDGVEFDRLRLSAFFDPSLSKGAMLQRWPASLASDPTQADEAQAARIRRRATVQAMHFGDYDHDGRATEFYVATDALPCGKSIGFVVGISKTNQRLHAFGTAAKPNQALNLQEREWHGLLGAHGPTKMLDWACGDHGSDEQAWVELRWTERGIDGTFRAYACDADAGGLLREESL